MLSNFGIISLNDSVHGLKVDRPSVDHGEANGPALSAFSVHKPKTLPARSRSASVSAYTAASAATVEAIAHIRLGRHKARAATIADRRVVDGAIELLRGPPISDSEGDMPPAQLEWPEVDTNGTTPTVGASTSPRGTKDNRALLTDPQVGMRKPSRSEVEPRRLIAVETVADALLKPGPQKAAEVIHRVSTTLLSLSADLPSPESAAPPSGSRICRRTPIASSSIKLHERIEHLGGLAATLGIAREMLRQHRGQPIAPACEVTLCGSLRSYESVAVLRRVVRQRDGADLGAILPSEVFIQYGHPEAHVADPCVM